MVEMSSTGEDKMYAVIEADGFFGDVATVCEVHVEREKAVKSVAHDRRWQIIRGELEMGQKVPRSSIGSVFAQVEKR
jgi:RNA binding exosome subunit